MVDLQGKDKRNISLPARLQSPDVTSIKPEDEDNHPTIVNLQKAMYEVILKDLQRKIERLQIRNDDLENFCDKVKNSTEIIDQESELELVVLNNSIATETKKVDELKKRCDEMEASRKNEELRHLEKIKQMEECFEKTRIQLHSEIKTISAKINVIEEFKLADESLRKKLNDQIETTLRKEDEMERTLTRLNYKSKIHKENLKKEAYQQILDTSKNFQLELRDTVSPTVQRLMRENIVLENELDRLWNDHSNMQDVELTHNDNTEEYHEKIKEAKSNTKRRLITCKIQNLLIMKLRSVHSKVKKELEKSFETAENFEEQYLQLLDKTKNTECVITDKFRKRKLEVMLHQERVKLALTNTFKAQSLSAFKRISDTLSSLKSAVNSALMIKKHGTDEELRIMNLQTFANHLLNIIKNCESEKWIAKSESTETVDNPANVYVIGDLGFEPKHIQIIERLCPEIKKSESKSVLSTLEILKELEQLPSVFAEQHQSLSSTTSFHNSGSTDISNSSGIISESEASKKESADRVEERETISLEEEEDDYEEEGVSDYEASQLEYKIKDHENTVL